MNEQNNGGPAFPTGTGGNTPYSNGMTLRDYFAAKAMQGMLANGETNVQALIQASYIMADAMLEERQA